MKDMAWIAGQYFGQINQFAELQMSQDALREAFVPKLEPVAAAADREAVPGRGGRVLQRVRGGPALPHPGARTELW